MIRLQGSQTGAGCSRIGRDLSVGLFRLPYRRGEGKPRGGSDAANLALLGKAQDRGIVELQVQPNTLPEGSRILLLDDVLATGGTLAASAKLIERANWEVAGISVVLELSALNGRSALPGRDIRSLLAV